MPTTVVHDAPHATLRRYGDAAAQDVDGEPILLVPPLAVTIDCFDLRPDQSLAADLLTLGRPLYVVDFGPIGYADRELGFEDWIDDILPTTIERVCELHGGRRVDVVTWSLGGTLTFLAAASHPGLPLRGIAAVGTPIDYSAIPYLAPIRAAGRLTGGRVLSHGLRLTGGLPGWAVRASFRATALQRELTKPWFVLTHLHEHATLARLEAVDRFIATMPGYPGRLYQQLYDRIVQRNELNRGQLTLGDRVVELAKVGQHVLIVAGDSDVIAPVRCVQRGCDVLTGAASMRFETAPGSHLGVLAGPQARTTTWAAVRGFLTDLADTRATAL